MTFLEIPESQWFLIDGDKEKIYARFGKSLYKMYAVKQETHTTQPPEVKITWRKSKEIDRKTVIHVIPMYPLFAGAINLLTYIGYYSE